MTSWKPMSEAPTDGTMFRMKIVYSDGTSDVVPAWCSGDSKWPWHFIDDVDNPYCDDCGAVVEDAVITNSYSVATKDTALTWKSMDDEEIYNEERAEAAQEIFKMREALKSADRWLVYSGSASDHYHTSKMVRDALGNLAIRSQEEK